MQIKIHLLKRGCNTDLAAFESKVQVVRCDKRFAWAALGIWMSRPFEKTRIAASERTKEIVRFHLHMD